ncbi:MAG: UDP-N-acetylglucosamine pyrophosphorylase [Erysipelotrichaceae bacterium]|nr:UDP-N-acetylglucosamine pyrophosphorylase [Erysipelotrichaceae bacterium]MDY5252847.1 UDP-N-acetylglucosamine pyrophosphorylase [Erysipelotrichaceae bacterium]
MFKIKDLYDLTHTLAASYLASFEYPWEALKGIKDMIIELQQDLDEQEYVEISEQVFVHKTAKIAPTAFIDKPTIIGANTEVRHGAFIRGAALVGNDCVIGNSVELKNTIIFDNVQVPHYNYVGDSILGYKSHMGAGSITSNLKSDRSLVVIKYQEDGQEKCLETNVKKFGAMLGDHVEVGCNAVLNPGTIIGRHSNVYPTACVRGFVPANSIVKAAKAIVTEKKEVK